MCTLKAWRCTPFYLRHQQSWYATAGENFGVCVCMVNAEFEYTWEYQGNASKLVRTPLTDKCFLTLTQGMALGLGGNPYGPAGTGKTESVKALGQVWQLCCNRQHAAAFWTACCSSMLSKSRDGRCCLWASWGSWAQPEMPVVVHRHPSHQVTFAAFVLGCARSSQIAGRCLLTRDAASNNVSCIHRACKTWNTQAP
jgi:hypothetical protein